MVEDKGLAAEAADLIGQYVQRPGGMELVESLLADTRLRDQKRAQEGLEEMKLLLHYCSLYGVLDKVNHGGTIYVHVTVHLGLLRIGIYWLAYFIPYYAFSISDVISAYSLGLL